MIILVFSKFSLLHGNVFVIFDHIPLRYKMKSLIGFKIIQASNKLADSLINAPNNPIGLIFSYKQPAAHVCVAEQFDFKGPLVCKIQFQMFSLASINPIFIINSARFKTNNADQTCSYFLPTHTHINIDVLFGLSKLHLPKNQRQPLSAFHRRLLIQHYDSKRLFLEQ